MKAVSFYRFFDLKEPQAFRDDLQARCEQLGLLGTILIASEGFNGTVAGSEAAVLVAVCVAARACRIKW